MEKRPNETEIEYNARRFGFPGSPPPRFMKESFGSGREIKPPGRATSRREALEWLALYAGLCDRQF